MWVLSRIRRHSPREAGQCILAMVSRGGENRIQQGRWYILLHERLKVVAATGFVYGIDSLGVVDVLDQVSQLAGRIAWQPGETRLLPEPDKDLQVSATTTGMTVVDWPNRIGSHYMESCRL